MWGWFGGSPAAQKRKDSPKNAILGLRSQLDMLQKREKHLQSQIDEHDATARRLVNKDKNAAKMALKRKKANEHALEQTQAQVNTLEQQINAIESANINRETLAAMEKASQAMKQIHVGLTPEKVDETMDKLRDQNALSEEIVNAITGNTIDVMDDAELEADLEQLQQEALDEQIVKTGNVPIADEVGRTPLPPVTDPISSKHQEVEDDEEAELRKLQAEMAM